MGDSIRRDHWILKNYSKKPEHSEPFSYSYVFKDGQLPYIAEHHPVRVSTTGTTTPDSKFHIPIVRRKSLKRRENAERHSAPLEGSVSPESPSKSDKLKRALSLSSMKNGRGSIRSTNTSRSNSVRSNSPMSTLQVPPMPSRSSSLKKVHQPLPPASVPVVTTASLTLTLPTPSSSPIPSQKSFDSRPSSRVSNSGSSFMSADDQLDLISLQRVAMGRLTSRPALTLAGGRDKALATLGITSPDRYPMTPPFTPPASNVPSKAPSLHEPNGRPKRKDSLLNSNQTTARSSYVDSARTSSEEARPEITVQTQPRPILKRKTSRFVEHIEDTPKKPAIERRNSLEITTVEDVKFEMQRPKVVQIREPQPLIRPAVARPAFAIRRSESMRTTPTAKIGRWSGVVCMAESRSVIAAGSAKLVSF